MSTVVLAGSVSPNVRTPSGGNSTVVCLPAAVTAALPATVWFASDFDDVSVRVAVYTDGTGWRVFDPVVVGHASDPVSIPLLAGDHKISIGRDSGVGPCGWTVVATA